MFATQIYFIMFRVRIVTGLVVIKKKKTKVNHFLTPIINNYLQMEIARTIFFNSYTYSVVCKKSSIINTLFSS